MELLSPAGNFEKLVAAVRFGADAVYFGGPAFGLRAFSGNLDYAEMQEAINFLHENGKKGYVAVNIFPSTSELDDIAIYLKKCEAIGVDGLIISDMGVFSIAKKIGIKVPISISTQSNTMNLAAVNFWSELGASRVILAREVNKDDMREIVKNATCEVESFVHGAICISMSGRCLISSYLTGRDANKGECTHPCRWRYSLMEETRQGEYFPVFEDERGTYLYNSKDMCLINRLGELIDMGVKSAKVEGRMKSVMYTSIVTGVYRKAIDAAKKDPKGYKADPELIALLNCVSNRGYTEGFYNKTKDEDAMNLTDSGYNRNVSFLGVVEDKKSDEITIACRAKFMPNESLTIITTNLEKIDISPEVILDEGNNVVENTRPNYKYKISLDKDINLGSLLVRFE